MPKYVFVTGGVLSSVGKGVVAASIGKMLRLRGFRTTLVKIDPYINLDAGTMNPYMHGEVFVTEDGVETDLDLGHYERFLGEDISGHNNITTGQVYLEVIKRERRGEYLGQCVQVIPHITDEIKKRIRKAAEGFDVVVVEVGGTVGDIEGSVFLEALRQMRIEEGLGNTVFVHVALVPILEATGEQKTKPLQHSVHELRRIGIQPDIIVARCREPLSEEAFRKISLFSNVPREMVFVSYDVDTVYRVPLLLEEQGLGDRLVERLGLVAGRADWGSWRRFVEALGKAGEEVSILMCGKYTHLRDAYISIVEALKHAGASLGVKPRLKWVEATDVEEGGLDVEKMVSEADGVLVLPGFGKRGAEGKIECIRVARTEDKPFLGICFGMQLAVVEFARNVAGLQGANSSELDPRTPHPVIDLLPEQRGVRELGGTLRLGAYDVFIEEGSVLASIYGSRRVRERHRHRYEVNPNYWRFLEERGLFFSAWDMGGRRVEAIELHRNFFFVAVQFHPEFKSRPERPSPVYRAFVEAALKYKRGEECPYKPCGVSEAG